MRFIGLVVENIIDCPSIGPTVNFESAHIRLSRLSIEYYHVLSSTGFHDFYSVIMNTVSFNLEITIFSLSLTFVFEKCKQH